MKYYMRSKIIPWTDVKPAINPSTMSYGFCEVFRTKSGFKKEYPNEAPIELEGDK